MREPQPDLQQQLAVFTNSINNALMPERNPWPGNREIYYIVDPQASRTSGLLNVEIAFRERNKKAVERFQCDPDCELFLISLKGGGQGLNLTAAEYVSCSIPWWNPAVEAQAIDRAYRIGQTNCVFAYRLITRDTVEEKVLELQSTKRELAGAIINADNSVIRNITGEDLRLLLS